MFCSLSAAFPHSNLTQRQRKMWRSFTQTPLQGLLISYTLLGGSAGCIKPKCRTLVVRMTLSLHVLWWITVSLALPKLSMLFEACAACLRFWMYERGKWRGDGRREGGEAMGARKWASCKLCEKAWGCFFFFFLFLVTTLHTAGRLIHSSAGLQYQSSNYRGIFFVILSCHPSLDQNSLS